VAVAFERGREECLGLITRQRERFGVGGERREGGRKLRRQ
jgi:hypothetical protein